MQDTNITHLFERRLTFPRFRGQGQASTVSSASTTPRRGSPRCSAFWSMPTVRRKCWRSRHHPGASLILMHLARRPPLVILAGDVGTGKTELAETVGDAVARQEKIDVTLFPMSLSTRALRPCRRNDQARLLRLRPCPRCREEAPQAGQEGRRRHDPADRRGRCVDPEP